MVNRPETRLGGGADVAVVFISHRLEDSILARFHNLECELPDGMDSYFAFDTTDTGPADLRRTIGEVGTSLSMYDRSAVFDVEYPDPYADPSQRSLVPGNVGLLFLHYARCLSKYDYFWFIEYDVAYTGRWSRFFSAFEDFEADLLGTTITPYPRRPDWYW